MAREGRPANGTRVPGMAMPPVTWRSAHPGIRSSTFLFKAPARIFGFHFETTSPQCGVRFGGWNAIH